MVVPRLRFMVIVAALALCLSLMPNNERADAFELTDPFAITAAYTAHILIHEVGHDVFADEVGAEAHRISLFTIKDGKFYPGVSTYQSIPEKSKFPYALGGERLAGFTFEYALRSYRRKPTVFNKALMFFACADFPVYTALANYVYPDNDTYDPNLVREETGWSKELMLGLTMSKALLNAYRVMNEDARFAPVVLLDKERAGLMIRFDF